ncbi:MAG TPA: alkaline phosphatase family protein [Candidatus Angelobacter sp.]|jgi:phospholipase C
MKRREFLGLMATLSSAYALNQAFPLNAVEKLFTSNPATSGVDHIVLVMMENRSFDHLMGWLPGANGRQAGLSYRDPSGVAHPTHRLSPDFTGCPLAAPFKDPDHSYTGGRIQYDSGRMDGFLLDPANDIYSIGYYVEQDQPFYSALARNFTTLDHYHCSILGPTFPNRVFQHAAQTDRLSNTTTISTLPTIWDKLEAAGVPATYYYSNVPFLALWGTKYLGISRPYAQFLADAAAGSLPAFSFVDPRYTVTDDGTGNDDHPHADIRAGDSFLAEAFHAVASGPNWSNTVFIVNFDEWGGFFDHVAPPRAAAPNGIDPDLVNGKALLGFRVPTVVASPFTMGNSSRPLVNHLVYDHTSVLKLLEWRWGLAPLTARDASSDVNNLLSALRLPNPAAAVPNLPRPLPPVPQPCPLGALQTAQDVLDLQQLALAQGWPVF